MDHMNPYQNITGNTNFEPVRIGKYQFKRFKQKERWYKISQNTTGYIFVFK